MTQTKLGSLIEALMNVVIGFFFNYFFNLLIFPLFGMHISMRDNFYMGMIFTVISVARSYSIRRLCNSYLHRASLKLANAMEAK